MLECGSLFLSLSETMLAVRFLVLMNRSRTNPFAPLLHRHSFVRSIAFVSDNFALSFFVFANYRNQWRKRVANISIMRIILQLKVCDGPVPCHCRKPKVKRKPKPRKPQQEPVQPTFQRRCAVFKQEKQHIQNQGPEMP